jgi:nucleotide-binding universal stress UspA family protein
VPCANAVWFKSSEQGVSSTNIFNQPDVRVIFSFAKNHSVIGPSDTSFAPPAVVMVSPLHPPVAQVFPANPHSHPKRVVLLPLDSASTPTSTALLVYFAKHVYRPGDELKLLRVVPPMRWHADEDAPGAGLANALAAGVSVVTLNQFADTTRDDSRLANWLDDDVGLLKASLLRDALPILRSAGVPEASVTSDVTASTMSLSSIGDVICEVAKDTNAGLVVMAKRGRGGFSESVLGSATDRVIRKCQSPVLIWNSCPELTRKEMKNEVSDDLDDPAAL